MASKNRITINLGAQEHTELAALSERYQVSMAWLGRQAVAEFLDRYRTVELQLPLAVSPRPYKDERSA